MTCYPSLTELALPSTTISQEGLDALLQHGTAIASFAAYTVKPTESRASTPCSWKKLRLQAYIPSAEVAAYLPLGSVEQLQGFAGLSMKSLPAGADVFALLQQAASNLAACPAWRQSPPDTFELLGCEEYMSGCRLFRRLAPLLPLQLRTFRTDLQCPLGGVDVRALASSLGTQLQMLRLSNAINSARRATLLASFWPAVARHLPRLNLLDLGSRVKAEALDFAMFCKAAEAPIEVRLDRDLFTQLQGEHVRANLREWGMQHVSITTW
jgi:hypothetical protein